MTHTRKFYDIIAEGTRSTDSPQIKEEERKRVFELLEMGRTDLWNMRQEMCMSFLVDRDSGLGSPGHFQ